jgi:hypothetical protein
LVLRSVAPPPYRRTAYRPLQLGYDDSIHEIHTRVSAPFHP